MTLGREAFVWHSHRQRFIRRPILLPQPLFDYLFVFLFLSPSSVSSPSFFLFATLELLLVPSVDGLSFFVSFVSFFDPDAPVFFVALLFPLFSDALFAGFAFFAVLAFGFSSSSCPSAWDEDDASDSSTFSSSAFFYQTHGYKSVNFLKGSCDIWGQYVVIDRLTLPEDFGCGAPFLGSFFEPGAFS